MRNVIGKRYGDWEIIEDTGEMHNNQRVYKGRNVKCGHDKTKTSGYWNNPNAGKGCGQCLNHLIGKRYGDWEIIEAAGEMRNNQRVYKGRNVKCGHEKTQKSGHWTREAGKGCGQCLADEREIAKAHKQIITGEL